MQVGVVTAVVRFAPAATCLRGRLLVGSVVQLKRTHSQCLSVSGMIFFMTLHEAAFEMFGELDQKRRRHHTFQDFSWTSWLLAQTQVLPSKLEGRTERCTTQLRSTIMARPETNPLLNPHTQKHVSAVLRHHGLNVKTKEVLRHARAGTTSVARARHMLDHRRVSTPDPFRFETPPVKKHAPVCTHARHMSTHEPLEFRRLFRMPCCSAVVEPAHELGVPRVTTLPSRHTCHGMDGLLVWLRRMSCTGTFSDLRASAPFNVPGARWSETELSLVFTWTDEWMDRDWGEHVAWARSSLTERRAAACAAALRRKGSLVKNCVG